MVCAIGQPAHDALCRAFWEQDRKFAMLAALILLQEKQPSERTVRMVQDILEKIMRNAQDYFFESGIGIILSIVLANGGDEKYQRILEESATQFRMSTEQLDESLQNMGLLYLIK